MIFGQLGNDTIQGDGSIDARGRRRRPAGRRTSRPLTSSCVGARSEAATDGDDYIEGGGGDDVIFGNLGQDDIIGGSSDLFSLTHAGPARPTAATALRRRRHATSSRNDAGDALPRPRRRRDRRRQRRRSSASSRRPPAGATYLDFTYDNYASEAAARCVPRAVKLLDYTPGGPTHRPLPG